MDGETGRQGGARTPQARREPYRISDEEMRELTERIATHIIGSGVEESMKRRMLQQLSEADARPLTALSASSRGRSANKEAKGDDTRDADASKQGRDAEDGAEGSTSAESGQGSRQGKQEEMAAAQRTLRHVEEWAKGQAYRLVKQGYATSLQEMLRGLPEEMRWREWKDTRGRSLRRFAKETKAWRVRAGDPAPQPPPQAKDLPSPGRRRRRQQRGPPQGT